MFKVNCTSKVTVDFANTIVRELVDFTKKSVLVGVPEDKAGRKDTDVTNAMLAFIHDKGSPLQGIPPRPFMDPGIKAAQDRINKEFLTIAKGKLGDMTEERIDQVLNRIGLIAQNSIKKVINEGIGFSPLKESTKRARLRKRKSSKKWSKAKQEEVMESMHPLVDTGAMRNSISYVVVNK